MRVDTVSHEGDDSNVEDEAVEASTMRAGALSRTSSPRLRATARRARTRSWTVLWTPAAWCVCVCV